VSPAAFAGWQALLAARLESAAELARAIEAARA